MFCGPTIDQWPAAGLYFVHNEVDSRLKGAFYEFFYIITLSIYVETIYIKVVCCKWRYQALWAHHRPVAPQPVCTSSTMKSV